MTTTGADDSETGSPHQLPGDPTLLVGSAVRLYGALALVAGAFMWARQGRAFFAPFPPLMATLVALAVALAVVFLGMIAAWRYEWARRMEAEFVRVLGPLKAMDVLILAASSAVAEEWVFRGVLQPWLGLTITSVLFAAAHPPLTDALIPWTLFAGIVGFALGALVEWSGSLWPAVVAHGTINGINLARLSRRAVPAPVEAFSNAPRS